MATRKTTNAKSKPTPTATKKRKISAEDIRLRAVEIYKERLKNGHSGDELSDWLSAEKELSKS
ncbi:MAG: hypothetical protein JW801_04620 [Bacteroidales bacterium]|nr:hypothetical protein [Bacteroidales bacterium]